MLDILFRGRRTDTGEWIESDSILGGDHPALVIDNIGYYIEPETLGRYSGVPDREGRKIFEGDLVIPEILGGVYDGYRWPMGAVVFEKGAFCIRMPRETVPLRNFAPRVSLLLAGNVYDRRDEDAGT